MEGRSMRRLLALLVSLAAAAAMPGTVSADPVSICPDGMILFPASLVTSGGAKDKNHNGLVCGKLMTGPTGGPDDRAVADDIVV
jgi:hypothetical protein